MAAIENIYEAWQSDDDSISLGTVESILRLRSQGTLGQNATLLHRFTASTWEHAMSIHHDRMEWEPYEPMGSLSPCPNSCGASYYPDGSGECPNCGDVS